MQRDAQGSVLCTPVRTVIQGANVSLRSECCTLAMWLRAIGVYISRGFGYPLGQVRPRRPHGAQGTGGQGLGDAPDPEM